MLRREFLSLPAGAVTAAALAARAQEPRADITLRIREINWELAPKRTIKTLAYNDQVPGPLLRVVAGRPLTVEVINDSDAQDIVHWHGLHIPSEVDGAVEEGTPPVGPRSRRRYTFTPSPAGTRWYHSHGMAHRDLEKSTYSGQAGMMIVEGGDDPGDYDREAPILLKEFEPRFRRTGPLDVEFRAFTINGKMAGAADPIRVRTGERVLFRIVNASATLHHRLALPAHQFRVVALDGNRVPSPAAVPVIDVSPGERVDAIVEMSAPGIWWLGETRDAQREAGMAIAVEYAGAVGLPRWLPPLPHEWNYGDFAAAPTSVAADGSLTLAFRAEPDGHHWTINGKRFPHTAPIVVREGMRQRLVFDNQSADDHPVHLHRHTFDVIRIADRRMSGIRKDVVVVPAWRQAEVDVAADYPGLSLFHCHQQFHMDMGFMTMLRYAD
jgi:FtsP/CotA-like multicopper oxidase with cupredoxin domain